MSAFRLGIVGIGDMAGVHAAAAGRLGVDLAVAAGADRARASALAESTGAALYESYDALLADPAVTGVDLCVPNDLHRRFAERAFAAGKHVLCEKPIALTLDDADAMIAGAKAAGVTLMVGHLIRFWPEYARLREVVRSGELGRIEWLSLRRLTGVLSATTGRDGWRASPTRSGGAALDLQIHDLDFACWLFGSPRTVYARGVRSANGTWDHLLTSVAFDGVDAMVEASFLMQSAPFDMAFHLVAERGVVTYRYSPAAFALHGLHGEGDQGDSDEPEPSLMLHRAGEESQGLYTPDRDSFEAAIDAEIGEFVASAGEHRPPTCTGDDARLSLAVSLASRQSCETGQIVRGRF
ncbi:MAG TPA: Gfo/Idh/MocA family oxidoreductase [Thermomicrobiales bacterium]|jgi:predicted dehydrogenase